MADTSKIEWTDATWNVLRGCTRVSEGCRNCYAEGIAARFSNPGAPFHGLAERTSRGPRWTGKVAFAEHLLDQPLRWKRPRRIFVNSMSDVFHESVPDEWIDRIFAVMALAPQHTFQLLTKRPERAQAYLTRRNDRGRLPSNDYAALMAATGRWNTPDLDLRAWPLSNVWLGVSVEDQASADERIPHLLATPAAVRFLSCEPLLGPLALDDMCDGFKFIDALRGNWWHDVDPPVFERGKPRLDWVICGGESGKGARPMHPDWACSLRDQCQAAGVAFFFKQWGEWAPARHDDDEPHVLRQTEACGAFDSWKAESFHQDDAPGAINWRRLGKSRAGRLLDGREWNQMPGEGG